MVILICIFSANSDFGRDKQNCYSLPTSEFGEKMFRVGVKIKGGLGNLNHTYFFLGLIT